MIKILIKLIMERLGNIPELVIKSKKLPRFWQIIILGSLILNFGCIGLTIYFGKYHFPNWSSNFISGCFLVLMVICSYFRFLATPKLQKKAEKPLLLTFLSLLLAIQMIPLFN
ncbi:MAG: hypothetical protein KGZ81_05815 [Flavobacteriales bacterium]|nr:hypothetical protein [Flavobacteriales bacterium]